MNTLSTATIQEIQALADAAGRIPGTDAACALNGRILALLGNQALTGDSFELKELPELFDEKGCDIAEPGEMVPASLSQLVRRLRACISEEAAAEEACTKAGDMYAASRDLLHDARELKSRAAAELSHYLGDRTFDFAIGDRDAQPE